MNDHDRYEAATALRTNAARLRALGLPDAAVEVESIAYGLYPLPEPSAYTLLADAEPEDGDVCLLIVDLPDRMGQHAVGSWDAVDAVWGHVEIEGFAFNLKGSGTDRWHRIATKAQPTRGGDE